jgi:hypothetical protein
MEFHFYPSFLKDTNIRIKGYNYIILTFFFSIPYFINSQEHTPKYIYIYIYIYINTLSFRFYSLSYYFNFFFPFLFLFLFFYFFILEHS